MSQFCRATLAVVIVCLALMHVDAWAASHVDSAYDDLMAQIAQLSRQGDRSKLESKVEASRRFYDRGDSQAALHHLVAFEELLQLNATKWIPDNQRTAMLESLARLRQALQGAPPPPNVEVIVLGNRTDPGLFQLKSDGDTYEFFGTKDEAGLATGVNGLVARLQDGTSWSVLFNDEGRPASIQTTNGITMGLTWESDTQFTVDIASSQHSVSGLAVTLPTPVTVSRAVASIATENALEPEPVPRNVAVVLVTKCGFPVNNAQVMVQADNVPLGGTFEYVGFRKSPGIYHVPVATFDPAAGEKLFEKCVSFGEDIIAWATDDIPQYVEALLPATVGALQSLALATGSAVIAEMAINLAVFAEAALPVLLAKVAVVIVAAAALCAVDAIILDRLVNTLTMDLIPTATVGSQTVDGSRVTVPAAGPFQQMDVDLPADVCEPLRPPVIFDARLNPGSLFPVGSTINMSFSGSDGSASVSASQDNRYRWSMSASTPNSCCAAVNIGGLVIDRITFAKAGTYELEAFTHVDAMNLGSGNNCLGANQTTSVTFDNFIIGLKASARIDFCNPVKDALASFQFNAEENQMLQLRWSFFANITADSRTGLGASASLSSNNVSWVTIRPVTPGGTFTAESGMDYTIGPPLK